MALQPPSITTTEGLVRASGIPSPNPGPYTDCSAAMVLWNEGHRIDHLLDVLQPWFAKTAIVVQSSTDQTLQLARARARAKDVVIADQHRGTGDASMPLLLENVSTKWVFVVAGDELPDDELLGSLWHATWLAERDNMDAVWVPFESIVEGVRYEEQHAHLRLFLTSLGWPRTMHSRPVSRRGEMLWPHGRIIHERSIDELICDYLRYYELGRGRAQWDTHNSMMIHDALVATAQKRTGWPPLMERTWWKDAAKIAFENCRGKCSVPGGYDCGGV